MPGTGSQQLVVFLGLALVIVAFWTGPQRHALASLWSAGGGGGGGGGLTSSQLAAINAQRSKNTHGRF